MTTALQKLWLKEAGPRTQSRGPGYSLPDADLACESIDDLSAQLNSLQEALETARAISSRLARNFPNPRVRLVTDRITRSVGRVLTEAENLNSEI